MCVCIYIYIAINYLWHELGMCLQRFLWKIQEGRGRGGRDKRGWSLFSQGIYIYSVYNSSNNKTTTIRDNELAFWRHLRRNTNYHSPCSPMKGTRWGKSGGCRLISLVPYRGGRLMSSTRMGWSNWSTTTNFNQRSMSMRPWNYWRVFEALLLSYNLLPFMLWSSFVSKTPVNVSVCCKALCYCLLHWAFLVILKTIEYDVDSEYNYWFQMQFDQIVSTLQVNKKKGSIRRTWPRNLWGWASQSFGKKTSVCVEYQVCLKRNLSSSVPQPFPLTLV